MSEAAAIPLANAGREATSDHALRADIQALRGWAVLVVLLHHAQLLPQGSAGYLGVDIFFVISGFVITRLLMREIGAGHFTFAGFYARRARRLLPMAYVVVALTLLAAPWFVLSDEFRDLAAQSWGALTFTANAVLWRQTGYFEHAAHYKPLLHMWSLAIEEQFYLLWPLALVLVPRPLWKPAAAVFFAASLLACLALNQSRPSTAFYLLPTRAWELAMGCMGALAWKPGQIAPAIRRMAWPSLAVVLLVPTFLPAEWIRSLPRPGFVELAACAATLALLMRQGASVLPRPLAPMVWLGDISYSLYLVHWPLLSLAANANAGPLSPQTRAGLALLSVALAGAMHLAVENPLRRSRWGPHRTFAAAGVGALLIAGLGVMVWTKGAAAPGLRTPNRGLSAQCDYDGRFDDRAECRSGPGARVLLFGDSAAMSFADALRSDRHPFIQATKSNCGPTTALAIDRRIENAEGDWGRGCLAFQQSVLEWLGGRPEVEVVVLATAMRQYFEGPLLVADSPGVRSVDPPTSERLAMVSSALATTAARIRAMGRRVVIVESIPESPGYDAGRCTAMRKEDRWIFDAPAADCSFDRRASEAASASPREALANAAAEGDIPVIRPSSAMCGTDRCRTQESGIGLYRDASHLSHEGSRWLGERMALPELAWKTAR